LYSRVLDWNWHASEANANESFLFNDILPHEPRLQASSSPIPKIRFFFIDQHPLQSGYSTISFSFFMLQKLALMSLWNNTFLQEYNTANLFSRYLRYTTTVWTAQGKSTAHLKMALKKNSYNKLYTSAFGIT